MRVAAAGMGRARVGRGGNMALGPLSEAVGPGSEGGMGWGPRKALAPLGGSAWKGEWRRGTGEGRPPGLTGSSPPPAWISLRLSEPSRVTVVKMARPWGGGEEAETREERPLTLPQTRGLLYSGLDKCQNHNTPLHLCRQGGGFWWESGPCFLNKVAAPSGSFWECV